MTTVIINERTKKGRTILEMIKLLSEGSNVIISKTQENKKSNLYNEDFVKMVISAKNSKKRIVLDPNDIWGSLGLK